ncbi:MAG: 3-hydroxybutyryl-CoA dehydrogenase, partial [Pikeienuella sp.]
MKRIACIGAGRMGRGIAHAVAYAGGNICLIDVKDRDANGFDTLKQAAISDIRSGLQMLAELGVFDPNAIPEIMARVSILPSAKINQGLANADIVFEAVPEVMEAKKQAFALFDTHSKGDAILASTTSTILSTDLAGLTNNPQNFLNAHWLNPAFLVPLVEVSPCNETSDDTLTRLNTYLEGIGKMPVTCKASPGYIVPRIQALAMNEAARLVEEGVASAEDVDKAVKYGFGLRFAVLGLLEFIDWGGGDILYFASKYLSENLDKDRFTAPDIVQNNMEQGRIGLKTGEGFFNYDGMDV